MSDLNKIAADSAVEGAVHHLLTRLRIQVGQADIASVTVTNGGYPCDDGEIQVRVALKDVTLSIHDSYGVDNATN